MKRNNVSNTPFHHMTDREIEKIDFSSYFTAYPVLIASSAPPTKICSKFRPPIFALFTTVIGATTVIPLAMDTFFTQVSLKNPKSNFSEIDPGLATIATLEATAFTAVNMYILIQYLPFVEQHIAQNLKSWRKRQLPSVKNLAILAASTCFALTMSNSYFNNLRLLKIDNIFTKFFLSIIPLTTFSFIAYFYLWKLSIRLQNATTQSAEIKNNFADMLMRIHPDFHIEAEQLFTSIINSPGQPSTKSIFDYHVQQLAIRLSQLNTNRNSLFRERTRRETMTRYASNIYKTASTIMFLTTGMFVMLRQGFESTHNRGIDTLGLQAVIGIGSGLSGSLILGSAGILSDEMISGALPLNSNKKEKMLTVSWILTCIFASTVMQTLSQDPFSLIITAIALTLVYLSTVNKLRKEPPPIATIPQFAAKLRTSIISNETAGAIRDDLLAKFSLFTDSGSEISSADELTIGINDNDNDLNIPITEQHEEPTDPLSVAKSSP